MGVIKFDRDFETLFNWDTDADPTTEQDYQNAVKNWTETEMNIVDTLLWQPTTEYATGNIVKTPSLPSQYVLRCAEAGTSGSTEPSYSGAGAGDTVTDGTVEWVIVSLATGNAADVDASNIGVNAEVDNSESWASAIGGGAIAEDDGRLVKGDTVYAVTSVMETNIATNTEAIEDNTEAIATNTANIEASAVKIDIDDKRISNIEKLLQGNLYDYSTDTDSKYVKTVPNGAMPYASLDTIGGKTVVMNQLVQNGNFVDISGWYFPNGIATKTVSNNVLTVTFTGSYNHHINKTGLSFTSGHHYYVCATMQSSDITTASISATVSSGSASSVVNNVDISTRKVVAGIFTSSYTTSSGVIWLTFGGAEESTGSGTIENVMIVDLTLLYGAGNEPSTVAEFQQQFPAPYYAFTQGTLLSAGVTDVVSKGKNLADYSGGQGYPSGTATSNTTKRIFPISKWIKGIDAENYYYAGNVTANVTDNKIEILRTGGTNYGVGIAFACEEGVTYTLSAVGTISSGYARIGIAWYSVDGTWISGQLSSTSPYNKTAPSGAVQGLIIVSPSVQNVTATYTNIQLEIGSTASTYSAPFTNTYPIPAEIRALEGYGWSAGTVFNYIDYERKVFVKCVDKVDLGTLSWISYATDTEGYSRFLTTSINTVAKKDGNILCAKYMSVPYADTTHRINGINLFTNGNVIIYDDAYATSTAPQFTSAMSGVYAYYELATPQEIDISAYLTDDNLISVESGGTLTFPNSNGDDYRIDVPSSETYMVDLQSAL